MQQPRQACLRESVSHTETGYFFDPPALTQIKQKVTTVEMAKRTSVTISLLVKVANACWAKVGKPAIMPAKISIDIPFPMFLSEINSPSHIRNIVPAAITRIALAN